jgi:putative acetyltransferase
MDTGSASGAGTPIRIRALEPRDGDALHAIMLQESSSTMTLQTPYHPAARWHDLANGKPGFHSLVAEVDGAVAGECTLHVQSNRRAHVGDIGMAVHEAYRGRGVGTALMAAVTELADNWLNLVRLELQVYTDNVPAIALYRAFGFVIEGELRAFAFRDGAWADAYFMARLRERPLLSGGVDAPDASR